LQGISLLVEAINVILLQIPSQACKSWRRHTASQGQDVFSTRDDWLKQWPFYVNRLFAAVTEHDALPVFAPTNKEQDKEDRLEKDVPDEISRVDRHGR
jgi:hypothetical protein